jgi:hypothetical protein
MANSIPVSVWDRDLLKPNECVGSVVLPFATVLAARLPPTWFPIYGPPDGVPENKVALRMQRMPGRPARTAAGCC